MSRKLDAPAFALPEDLDRVCIVGTSGVGKSTVSRRLAAILNSRHIELDRLHWKPDWQEATPAEFHEALSAELEAHSRWVLDGNYRSLAGPTKRAEATCLIWLDYSLPRNFWQAATRAVRRIRNREEIWPGTGNRESFRRTFLSHDSVLLWTLITFRANRRRYGHLLQDPDWSHIRRVRLESPQATDRFLNSLREQVA